MTEINYVKAILRNLNCSSKTRKQFHDTLIQMITEKKEKGMSMAEIIDTIGDPEEVSNEMNAYLSEKNLFISRKILTAYKSCLYCIYILCTLAAGICFHLFSKQIAVLKFINDNQDASAFMFASSPMIPVQWLVLGIVSLLILILIILQYTLKSRYMS